MQNRSVSNAIPFIVSDRIRSTFADERNTTSLVPVHVVDVVLAGAYYIFLVRSS